MDIKTIVTIGVIGILVIATIVTYQFIKPYYDRYQINQKIQYEKLHTTDPKLLDGMDKFLNDGNK